MVDEQTIDLIADRVIAALREDLETIVAELSASNNASDQMTVGQVAHRLGVARSTVYAHWREWGGYKLGPGDKAPIRFDSTALPIVRPSQTAKGTPTVVTSLKRTHNRSRRRDLLVAAPGSHTHSTGWANACTARSRADHS